MPIDPEDLQIDIFNKVDQAITEVERLHLQVGWFESAKYDENTPVAAVAAQNEYGNAAKNIPPRSFLRTTIEEKTSVWKGLVTRCSKKIIAGTLTGEQMMGLMGEKVAGDIREKIISIYEPPLSPVTIKNRLRQRKDEETVGLLDKPLIFEGILMNTVSYIVSEGEEVHPFEEGQPP